MNNPAELDIYIEETRKLAEELRMEISVANEAVARLRQARSEVQHLLETEVPRIVAEAVALHITRSTDVGRRR